ncbi:AraC family transcriptional regulator ligand-binding domain-containing protein, partial [Acinetobacter baumannii]
MRSIASMQLMAQYAQERGMPVKLCLEGTGLSAMELDNPETMVTGQQELRLASNLVRYFDDEPGLGLEVGCRYHFTSIGVLGLAII